MSDYNNKFIICKGSSGMGNRILAACTAFLYAKISQRRIVIDWKDGAYADENINSFPLFFNCPKAELLEDISITESIYPELWKNHLDCAFGALKKEFRFGEAELSFDVGRLDYDSDIIVFCAYTHKIAKMTPLFTGEFEYLANLSYTEILKTILASEFNLNPEIKASIDEYKSKYFNAQMIGVHVRYSDLKVPVKKIIKKLKQVLIFNKANGIFLATDSQEIIEEFNQSFDQVIMTPKWMPPKGERMHQNWHNCPDRFQNGIEALTDIYLLAECDHLIFSSRSSFGYVASLLSKASQRNIYDINNNSPLIKRFHGKVFPLINKIILK